MKKLLLTILILLLSVSLFSEDAHFSDFTEMVIILSIGFVSDFHVSESGEKSIQQGEEISFRLIPVHKLGFFYDNSIRFTSYLFDPEINAYDIGATLSAGLAYTFYLNKSTLFITAGAGPMIGFLISEENYMSRGFEGFLSLWSFEKHWTITINGSYEHCFQDREFIDYKLASLAVMAGFNY